jgi:hypothetical protein
VKLTTYLRLVPRLWSVTSTSSSRFKGVVLKHRASLCHIWSIAEIILQGKIYDGVILSGEYIDGWFFFPV